MLHRRVTTTCRPDFNPPTLPALKERLQPPCGALKADASRLDDMDGALSRSVEGILLPAHARLKEGDDIIFSWLSRCQKAKDDGEDVVNGTIGTLLDEDGTLAINPAVTEAIQDAADIDASAYSPLRGLATYRRVARSLALGPRQPELKAAGLSTRAIATPGGCGALYLSARNLADPGDAVLLRSTHWGPYATILAECGLRMAEWPLTADPSEHHVDGQRLSGSLELLAKTQRRVLGWLNDPAHNPTGLSLPPSGRDKILRAWIEAARRAPDTGFSLILDTAYSAYADESHGWTETVVRNAADWPSNLFLAWAFSASKSHTMYGLRCGALVMLHPDLVFLDRMMEVCLHTGRGTWSGTPRLPQAAIVAIHTNPDRESRWRTALERLRTMLSTRRQTFIDAVSESEMPMLASMDGYFAFLPDDNPEEICEAAASRRVYVVPLRGGVRVGICSMTTENVSRAGTTLVDVWSRLRGDER